MMLSVFPLFRRKVEEAPPKSGLSFGHAVVALLVFTALAFLRNAYAFSYPTLYGEDGLWIGHIMTRGFWHVLGHARTDYSVSGLIALDGLSLIATRALFLSDISSLPQVIAIVASLAFGFVATLPLLTLQGRLHPAYLWLMGFAIVLLPVGRDGYEIFGRILNLGFYMPVIAQFVLFVLLYRHPPRWAAVLLNAAALGLMWSFPVVIGQYALFIAFDLLKRRREAKSYVPALLGSLVVLALGLRALDVTAFTTSGGIPLPFNPANLLEFVVARSTIFPLVAPIYEKLTNLRILAILAVLAVSVAIYFRRQRSEPIGLLDYRVFLLLNFGVMWAATLVMRKGLTSILDGYTTSLPDRYFTGVNIMFLTAWMAFGLGNPSPLYRRVAATGFAALIVAWAATVPMFQRSVTDLEQRGFGTFRDTLCDTAAGRGLLLSADSPNVVAVPVYPHSPDNQWRIAVPRPIFEQTVRAQCR